MATTADTRDCAFCGQNLASGTTTTSKNAGTFYLCTQCVASADAVYTPGTLAATKTS